MLSSNTGGDDANKNSSSGAVVGDAVGVGVEGMSGVVDVTGEVDSGAGHDLAQEEGELGDASMLDLDVTEADDANKNSSSGTVVGDAVGVGVKGVSGVVDVLFYYFFSASRY